MNLILDLGNSWHKVAVFDGDNLVTLETMRKLTHNQLAGIIDTYPINAAILCSVDHYDEELAELLQNSLFYIHLSHATPLPIVNAYTTPTTLGKDRLSAAVGANALFPGENVLCIDAGTCIKYDFINADGVYHGGAISPGLIMRLQAMHNFTARLPLIVPETKPEMTEIKLIGDDTTSSLLSGALNGAKFEVEGVIAAYSANYANLTVLITGGDAGFFELHLKSRIFARPNLVLEGLNTILKYNLNK